MNERRRHHRWPRRVEVRFWPRQQPEDVRRGFTSDISATGAFIQTREPIGREARIRVEFATPDGGQGVLLEAVVRRARRVHRELHALKTSGMGVRFLGIHELLREVMPQAMEGRMGALSPWPEEPPPIVDEEEWDDEPASGTEQAEVANEDVAANLSPAAPGMGGGGLQVHFSSLEALQQAYQRDLQHGGLFISTDGPGPVGSRVSLSVFLPGHTQPLPLTAKVVHVFEKRLDNRDGRNLLAGMGVMLDDPDALLIEVRRLLGMRAGEP